MPPALRTLRQPSAYGVDYQPDEYEQHTEVAREAVRERLLLLLAEGHDVVLAPASGSGQGGRSTINGKQAGGCWRLVCLRACLALLRARLHGRVERFDANAAFPVTGELLARYLETFEPPSGEGE